MGRPSGGEYCLLTIELFIKKLEKEHGDRDDAREINAPEHVLEKIKWVLKKDIMEKEIF